MTLNIATLVFGTLVVTGPLIALDYYFLTKVRERRAHGLMQTGKRDEALQARERPPIISTAYFLFPIALFAFLLLKLEFALVMLIFLATAGLLMLCYRLFWSEMRKRRAEELTRAGKQEEAEQARREPVLVEYARAFFPVILLVFVIRSFLVEPFRIPSGSMMPNLLDGDFILVNKFSYGVRLPVANVKIWDIDNPKRGDVVVFRFPPSPSTNFIKRIVGVPGDRVVYRNKRLYINDKLMEQTDRRKYVSPRSAEASDAHDRVTENLDGKLHDILVLTQNDSGYFERIVPPGEYFVMGDNRDHSHDSRYWGFVPDRNMVGRAFLIWFSVNPEKKDITWDRIGNSIQ
jgi:signal peptidase I